MHLARAWAWLALTPGLLVILAVLLVMFWVLDQWLPGALMGGMGGAFGIVVGLLLRARFPMLQGPNAHLRVWAWLIRSPWNTCCVCGAEYGDFQVKRPLFVELIESQGDSFMTIRRRARLCPDCVKEMRGFGLFTPGGVAGLPKE